ncbi:L-Aspartase-like protein, partial [Sporodiniella umbellata]
IYGVNTGFGGSADTRNNNHMQLQISLLKLLAVGITSLKNENHIIDEKIVRAAMIIRLNSNIKGYSGVKWKTLEYLTLFLNNNITPYIPLSYICNCLIGKNDKKVIVYKNDKRIVKPVAEIFEELNIKPLVLDAKEGLAIVNGTAFSAAISSLNIIDSNILIVFSQILTAMFVEALDGSDEYFEEFTQYVRPHKGQTEVAKNIKKILKNSNLINKNKYNNNNNIVQDRYSSRTSPQWIGPQIETLYECIRVTEIELNSTTDNPIIDFERDKIYHGGNFQAMSITNCMENIRLSLNHIAKIIYSQNSEIINKDMNNGLSPNLCFENPSVDYGFKGIEISMASYMSEISYLSNPVSTNVQSAELHNQSINSLAFISGRYTQSVIEILQLMVSAQIYTLCQAIDLRIIKNKFTNELN